ncbi:MAG: hypothetical protein WCG16_00255 [Methylococcales bacterium]
MTTKLLAGPILRRTTTRRVCVWLATAEPLLLQLTITDDNGSILGKSNLQNITQQRLQVGKNLWVYLLQALPDADVNNPYFALDTLIYYRLDEIDEYANSIPLDLADLAYGSYPYPSFFIPTQLKQLLHGSCRKPHGGFNSANQIAMPDALSHGQVLLENTYDNLALRPAILLLTGDQIYADDVAISLLAMLRQQSVVITGKQETLPLSDSFNALNASENTRLDPGTLLLHGRKETLTTHNTGFSSSESENHLFTFGEFAAHYLYAFGNQPDWEPVWDWHELESIGLTNQKEAKTAWEAQRTPLMSYHKTLPMVRKLMANIATYMIFDDHDVTDDWNINGNWYDNVRNSPLGRRIVSNALASYWAFQGWGNDPDNFDKDFILTISQHLNDDANDADIGNRYDLHTWKNRGWGFSIATEPPIIVMDSRTQRQYENKYYPAQLLDRYALDWLRVEWAKLKTGQNIDQNSCPIIVATTPVIGFSTIEFVQQLALWLAGLIESWPMITAIEEFTGHKGFLINWMVNTLDAESWSANKDGFFNLMDVLSRRMGIKRCLFLSGDVHYAFTAEAEFKYQNNSLRCYQLTSSALSNEPDAKQSKLLNDADKLTHDIKITHRNWALLPQNRWSIKVQLVEAENTESHVISVCNLGLVEFKNALPSSHTLLTGDNYVMFPLPEQEI